MNVNIFVQVRLDEFIILGRYYKYIEKYVNIIAMLQQIEHDFNPKSIKMLIII